MSESVCPFYKKACILKSQANLSDFKNEHDCSGLINKCSFFAKEKLKQAKIDAPVKILIRRVENVYMVRADAIVYPTNNLLEVDKVLKTLTKGEIDKKNVEILKKGIKMGYPYYFEMPSYWPLKQKYFINAVVAGESGLVNEADMRSCMKKSLLAADALNIESVLVLPSDYGTHDLSLTSLSQLSSIFMLYQQHKFSSLKNIYICMSDEETEQSFIEYFNRIFGEKKHEQENERNTSGCD